MNYSLIFFFNIPLNSFPKTNRNLSEKNCHLYSFFFVADELHKMKIFQKKKKKLITSITRNLINSS